MRKVHWVRFLSLAGKEVAACDCYIINLIYTITNLGSGWWWTLYFLRAGRGGGMGEDKHYVTFSMTWPPVQDSPLMGIPTATKPNLLRQSTPFRMVAGWCHRLVCLRLKRLKGSHCCICTNINDWFRLPVVVVTLFFHSSHGYGIDLSINITVISQLRCISKHGNETSSTQQWSNWKDEDLCLVRYDALTDSLTVRDQGTTVPRNTGHH
jgi:hypothetical protein